MSSVLSSLSLYDGGLFFVEGADKFQVNDTIVVECSFGVPYGYGYGEALQGE